MTNFKYYPAFLWAGARPAGPGFPPYVEVVAATPEYKDSYQNADQVAASLAADLSKRYKAWAQSAPEHGLINGQLFVRIYWHGTDANTGVLTRGFDYVTQEGKTYIEISSLQAQPDPQGLLALAEASAMTFRYTPTPPK